MNFKIYVYVIFLLCVSCSPSDDGSELSQSIPVEVELETSKDTLTVEGVQAIVDRAVVLARNHVPFSEKDDYVERLERVLVIDQNGNSPQLMTQNSIVFQISEIGQSFQKKGTDLMRFLASEFYESGTYIVLIKEDIYEHSRDLDLNASMLIHEIKHVLQTKDSGPINSYDELIAVEDAAWSVQTAVYFAEHPEMLDPVISADCQSYTGFELRDGFPVELYPDRGAESMCGDVLYYHFCGENYLRDHYPRNPFDNS